MEPICLNFRILPGQAALFDKSFQGCFDNVLHCGIIYNEETNPLKSSNQSNGYHHPGRRLLRSVELKDVEKLKQIGVLRRDFMGVIGGWEFGEGHATSDGELRFVRDKMGMLGEMKGGVQLRSGGHERIRGGLGQGKIPFAHWR